MADALDVSGEELCLQPMPKKSEKENFLFFLYVPDDREDEKYSSRRHKNTIVANKSRDAHRLREHQNIIRVSLLEEENAILKVQLENSMDEIVALGQQGIVETQAGFLGPNLLDNPDLMILEYTVLDEFLSENGFPLAETSADPSPLTSPSTSAFAAEVNEANENRSHTSASTNQTPSSVELLSSESSSSYWSMLNSDWPAMVSVDCASAASALAAKCKGLPPVVRQPLHDNEDDDRDEDDEAPVARNTARRGDDGVEGICHGEQSPSPWMCWSACGLPELTELFLPEDLVLSMLPGESFDPRARCFSGEELRLQAVDQKSTKQLYVPDDLKDEKYWSRRQKNNIAARKSRNARRLREYQNIMRVSVLEEENAILKEELQKTNNENVTLRERLQKYEHIWNSYMQ